jgi:hypothetical protein
MEVIIREIKIMHMDVVVLKKKKKKVIGSETLGN